MYKALNLLKKYWPLILILASTFILRVWKINELFYFTYDESIPAFVGRRLILWHHVPLIGGVTPFSVHITPYFYWFLALLLYLGKLNPVIWGWAGAFISIITVFLIYKLAINLGNKKMAISASIIWSFSYLANIYDRHFWALYWGPILSLLSIYSLIKILKGDEKFTYLLALTFIVGISTDPSNIVFIILSVVVWIYYKIPFKKSTLISILLIFFSLLPLVIFDLKHDFENTRPFLKFWQKGKNNPSFSSSKFIQNSIIFPQAFSRLIYTYGDNESEKQYSYCQNYVVEKYKAIPKSVLALFAILLISYIFWSIKINKNRGWKIITILLALYLIGIQVYGTLLKADIFEHYITGLFTVFILIFAKFISQFPRKIWLTILAVFLAVNLYKLSLAQNTQSLKNKKDAIEYTIKEVGDSQFSLESLSTCWRLNGYRYLFSVFGKEPAKSYVDPYLGYLYGSTPIAEEHPQIIAAFIMHDFGNEQDSFYKSYAVYKSHEIKSEIFSNIEVIIMDNKSKWFDKNQN